jgi:hypothetical protein
MPVNIKLTDNFRLKEFFVSRDHKAIADKLFDECNNFQIHLGYNLAYDAQRMRDHIDAPLIITSGYRDDNLNKLTTGSADRSLHTQMLAFDAKTDDDRDLLIIYLYVTNNPNLFQCSECFLYRSESGIYTNIHFARQTAGYDKVRPGIMVRLDSGGVIPLEHYLEEYENG